MARGRRGFLRYSAVRGTRARSGTRSSRRASCSKRKPRSSLTPKYSSTCAVSGAFLRGTSKVYVHRPAPARGRAPVFQGEIVALWVRETAEVARHAQHPVAQRGRFLPLLEEPAVPLRRQLHLVVHEGRVLVVGRQKHLEGERRPVIRRLRHGKRHAPGGFPLHPARGQIRHALRQRGRGRRRRRAKEQQRRHKRADSSFHLSKCLLCFPVLRKTVIHTTNGRAQGFPLFSGTRK